MKHTKKIIATFLAVVLFISVLPISAFAAVENTPKEEVIYINLNADGSVKEMNVVNIFDLDEDGNIIDYGKYESLRNMTGTEDINYQNTTVNIDAKAGKLYYEGKLSSNVMPWNISIRYYIDGNEYSAKEIAGKSGKLDIKMSITQNQDCNSSFFEGYALQVTFVLDADNASNIVASGATLANVGSDKQITYTILPNTEKDIFISADVKNFEMTGIAINGIRMNLAIDIDDSVLQDKVNELIGAVGDLDDGAEQINNGVSDLNSASGELNTAAGELHSGVNSLYDGSVELQNGLNAIVNQNSTLTNAALSAFEALCTAAQTQLNSQLSANGLDTVTLTPATYSDVLLDVLAKMDADEVYKKAYNAALAEVTAQVEAAADTLYKGYIESQADAIYLTYVESEADALYRKVASEAVLSQLVESGYTIEQASAYLQTSEGQTLVKNTVSSMTEDQKAQIISVAVDSLTAEQKQLILQGAIDSLTDEQKAEIRNGYIEQMMASETVINQMNEAVKVVNSAAAEVSALKGQLDNYGVFYNGLVDYTNAVSSAANGANTLTNGLNTLFDNTATLKNAIGELNTGIGTLKDGTTELKEGTTDFVNETSDMDTQVSNEINSLTSSLTGSDIETISFVSEQNTNVKSVQFVIKTESIAVENIVETPVPQEEHLTFWHKLLRLFGLY